MATTRVSRAISPVPQFPDKSYDDDRLLVALIVAEVEAFVRQFETAQEAARSQLCLQQRVPDYSWLATSPNRPRKFLTIKERAAIETTAESLLPDEFNEVKRVWLTLAQTSSSRDHLFELFSVAVHDVISKRPRKPQTSADAFINFLRQRAFQAEESSSGHSSARSDGISTISPQFPLFVEFDHIV